MDKTAKAKELIRYAEEIVMTSEEILANYFGVETKRLVKNNDKYYLIEMVDGNCTSIVELEETK